MQPLPRTTDEPRGLGDGGATASDQGNGNLHQLIGACARFGSRRRDTRRARSAPAGRKLAALQRGRGGIGKGRFCGAAGSTTWVSAWVLGSGRSGATPAGGVDAVTPAGAESTNSHRCIARPPSTQRVHAVSRALAAVTPIITSGGEKDAAHHCAFLHSVNARLRRGRAPVASGPTISATQPGAPHARAVAERLSAVAATSMPWHRARVQASQRDALVMPRH